MTKQLEDALNSRPFQKKGVEFCVKNKKVVIADQPGLGKTIQAIAAVQKAGVTGTILIVAPKTAALVTWPAEIKRWTDEPVTVIGGNLSPKMRKQRLRRLMTWNERAKDKRGWVIVTPNYLRMKVKTNMYGNYVYDDNGKKVVEPVREGLFDLLKIPWGAIIVDEGHQTLAGATGNIKRQSAQRQGLGLLSTKSDGLRIVLSGTPFRGKQENLWGILNWLYPKQYTSYWSWVDRHFGIYNGQWGQTIGTLKSEKRLAEELKNIMIRRTKGEVVSELPPKLYGGTPLNDDGTGPIAVWLDMEETQQTTYEQMFKDAIADLDGGQLVANGILAEMMRLKQLANSHGYVGADGVFYPQLPSNKFDWIVEFLAERGIEKGSRGESKVIIASQFTKLIELYADELRKLGIECFTLTGKTSEKDRVLLQDSFQNDPDGPQVFLLNTKAGGVSLTLDAADDVIIVDSTYSSDDQEQVEDRAHRISRMHNVTIWNLASKGTIDETIAKYTLKHEVSIKKILDGERGIEYAKLLLTDKLED